jgi:hypothetical protein
MNGYGFGIVAPFDPTMEWEGLTHATDPAIKAMEKALSVMTLELKWTNHTFGARAIPIPPIPGMKPSAKDALDQYAEKNVVMVDKSSLLDFMISSSASETVRLAKTGSTHAIVKGPPELIQSATTLAKVEALPKSSWFVPALIGVGLVGAFLWLRR